MNEDDDQFAMEDVDEIQGVVRCGGSQGGGGVSLIATSMVILSSLWWRQRSHPHQENHPRLFLPHANIVAAPTEVNLYGEAEVVSVVVVPDEFNQTRDAEEGRVTHMGFDFEVPTGVFYQDILDKKKNEALEKKKVKSSDSVEAGDKKKLTGKEKVVHSYQSSCKEH
ncbi:hypothetical protein AMTR_s00024p00062570 [Amborella trichopoda]|uniref:Uncharacterized protein n=1 Tax=Amborella trichopoda TaxID=13333 RepID=W1PUP1_AMBTC|nr:hypothetical protein AMTR_s00024p00062570 [Amborella trichopoda]